MMEPDRPLSGLATGCRLARRQTRCRSEIETRPSESDGTRSRNADIAAPQPARLAMAARFQQPGFQLPG